MSPKRPSKQASLIAASAPPMPAPDVLAREIGQMIDTSRRHLAQTANAALTTLYWQIGARIRQDVLKDKRAAYGAEIVAALGRQLEAAYGRGFGEKNLRRMVQFVEAFPDAGIVAALWRQLGWSHFKALIPMKEPIRALSTVARPSRAPAR